MIGFLQGMCSAKVAQNLMGRYNHCLSLDATIMYQKTTQSLVNVLLCYHSNTMTCNKTPIVTVLGPYNLTTAR